MLNILLTVECYIHFKSLYCNLILFHVSNTFPLYHRQNAKSDKGNRKKKKNSVATQRWQVVTMMMTMMMMMQVTVKLTTILTTRIVVIAPAKYFIISSNKNDNILSFIVVDKFSEGRSG